MQLNELKPNTKRATKRKVGRGGKRGKTAGRGHKGQKQHGGHGIRPEMRDFIKKLPKLRGHGINRSRTVNDSRVVYMPINLDALEQAFKAGEAVTPETLVEKGLLSKRGGKIRPVKLLARGKLTKKLSVEGVKISETAKVAVEKVGGSVK